MYPEKLIRGISTKDQIAEEGPSASLFYFSKMPEAKKYNRPSGRADGLFEESINWYDDEGALTALLKQRKEQGDIQFKAGAVILLRNKIDRIRRVELVNNRLSYERNALPDNKYHGNLLMHHEVPISTMRNIAAMIAVECWEKIVPQAEG